MMGLDHGYNNISTWTGTGVGGRFEDDSLSVISVNIRLGVRAQYGDGLGEEESLCWRCLGGGPYH